MCAVGRLHLGEHLLLSRLAICAALKVLRGRCLTKPAVQPCGVVDTPHSGGSRHGAESAEHLAFSVTFMEVDNGYVARPGAAPTNAKEVDRPGVKIAVALSSAPETVLRRLIKKPRFRRTN